MPTLRESENIAELADRIELLRVEHPAVPIVELLVVDDDSRDGIEAVIARLNRSWVRLLTRNPEEIARAPGLAFAVLHGIAHAAGDTIVVMDADLSHPPESIPAILAALKSAEIAVGSRFIPGGSTDAECTLSRRINSAIATLLARPLTDLADPMSGFLAFRRDLVHRAEPLAPLGYKVGLELVVRSRSASVVEVPIHFKERRRGQSKLSIRIRLQYLHHLARLLRFTLSAASLQPFAPHTPSCQATQPGTPGQGTRRWWAPALSLVLIAIVCTTFGRVASHTWLDYDDKFHIIHNPHFEPLTSQSWLFFWQEQFGNLFIPVSYNVFAAQVWVAERLSGKADLPGISPALFHLTKPALHAISALLVFGILLRIIRAQAPSGIARCNAAIGERPLVLAAFIGAAIFAVHPLQVESVAWISETRGLLAGLFSLLAILLHLSAWPHHGEALPKSMPPRCSARIATLCTAATLSFAFALLSKPSAIPIPIVAAFLALWLSMKPRLVLFSLLPWAALSVAAVLITQSLQPGSGVSDPAPIWARPFIAGDALAFYIAKLFWPFDLAPDYGRTPSVVLSTLWPYVAWLFPAALALVLTAIAWPRRGHARTRTSRWLRIGPVIAFASFIAAISPVLGLITFDHQNISTVADRYTYLPMLAVSIAAMLTCIGLWSWPAPLSPITKAAHRVLAFTPPILVVLLSLRSADQLRHWKDDLALWTHSRRVSPQSFTSAHNLGDAYAQAGRYADAIATDQAALKLRPGSALTLTNLAWAHMDRSEHDVAAPLFARAVELDPTLSRSRLGQGLCFIATRNTPQAIASFREAARLNPRDVEAHANLGLALAQAGDIPGAREAYRRALDIRPHFAIAWFNLGVLEDAQGRTAETIDAFERALAIDPHVGSMRSPSTSVDGPSAAVPWYRLANAYAKAASSPTLLPASPSPAVRADRLRQAAEAYGRAIALHPTYVDALNNLGLVQIRRGEIDNAIASFQRASELSPVSSEAAENLRNARLLKARQP